MKIHRIKKDLHLMCVSAANFPTGIPAAFHQLKSKLPAQAGRTFFGISYPDQEGGMIYKAGVLATFPGEAARYDGERFVIQKGEYLTEKLINWRKHEELVGQTFRKLANSRPDTVLPSIEWYPRNAGQGQAVVCMLRIDPSKAESIPGQYTNSNNVFFT